MLTDRELIEYAERMVRQVRPPLLDLCQRFLQLTAQSGDAKPKFDKVAYMRTYMRDWRQRQAQAANPSS
jgi:hypothetical protein